MIGDIGDDDADGMDERNGMDEAAHGSKIVLTASLLIAPTIAARTKFMNT